MEVIWKGKRGQTKWDSAVLGLRRGEMQIKQEYNSKKVREQIKIKEHLKVLFLSLNKK